MKMMKRIFHGSVNYCSNVEEYPLLYDKANPDFKNKYARLAAWEEIATSMDTDGLFPLCIS